MQFLDLKTDYAFKKVFGSEESKNALRSVNEASLTRDALEAQTIALITKLSHKEIDALS